MTCAEFRKHLPERALGDLDVERSSAMTTHLADCADCRAADAKMANALGLLKAVAPVSPSTERRSAAVAAMARAQAERPESLPRRARRTWAPWIAAAAAFLVLVASPAFRARSWSLQVASLRGRADLLDRSTGTWRPLAPSEKVRVGDRLVTQPGALVELSSGTHRVWVDQETSIDLVDVLSLALDRGKVCVIAEAGGQALRVSDVGNNVVRVPEGRVEIGLHDVHARYAGARQSPGGESRLPEPRTETSRRLVARVDRGVAELCGTQEQRLRAGVGQSGTFDIAGQPSTGAAEGAVAPWTAPDGR